MPGDSTLFFYTDSSAGRSYYIGPDGDTFSQPDKPVHLHVTEPYGQPENRLDKKPEDTDTVFTSIVFFAIAIILVRVFGPKEEEQPYQLMSPAARRKKAAATVKKHGALYDELLDKYNPYYKDLSPLMRSRFLQRTVEFAQAKDFRFHELEEDDSILILISGAAVQLTFGLPNFLMDYFNVIHVIRKEYVLHQDNETYYGHVSRNGIYISWNHFAKGYLDYTDGVNVGLHEMAHAVSYDVFLGYQDRHDRGFKKRLQEFRSEGGPVFRAMRQGDPHLLDSYAATNFDEFWAVCIETFFETPVAFRDEEPELYSTICELLNQDPLKKDKIIDKRLAGIRY